MSLKIFSRTKPFEPKNEVIPHDQWDQITYEWGSAKRNIKLMVRPFSGITVKLPHRVSRKSAEKIVRAKTPWIIKMLEHCQAVESQSIAFHAQRGPVDRNHIKTEFLSRLQVLAAMHGFQFKKLTIRDQKTRWGSCSATNNISLNLKLFYLPPDLIDYVMIHELAHTREKNHSPRFWSILFDILGKKGTKQAKRRLHDFEFLFYPPPGN